MSLLLKIVLMLVLAGAAVVTAQPVEDETMPERYRTERFLGGLKIKLSDNFTIGGWGALYYGNSYYPNRFLYKPYMYQGYDMVPGFEIGLGEIIGNLKLSVGADYYFMWRKLSWDDEPDQSHVRARGNIILTMPFAGNFTWQIIQRFERILERRWLKDGSLAMDPDSPYLRLRTAFKVTAPPYTRFKIAPYAGYEGFVNPMDAFYYEWEFGFAVSPVKGLSFNLADQIQSQPERPNYETHQITVNMFYTLDVSRQLTRWVESVKYKEGQ